MLTDRANHYPGRGKGGISTSGPENTKTRVMPGAAGNVATPAPYSLPKRRGRLVKTQKSARPHARPLKPETDL